LRSLAVPAKVPETLKRELTDQLIAKEAFKEAFDVWKTIQGNLGK